MRVRVLTILGITALGFASKFYRGWAEDWMNNSLGGVFYVVFWCLVWDFFRPRDRVRMIVSSVFVVTSTLEVLQLTELGILVWMRKYFIGRTLVGTTFAPEDFFYYLIGSVMGYGLLQWIRGGRVAERDLMARDA